MVRLLGGGRSPLRRRPPPGTDPSFTAESIFGVKEPGAAKLVIEIGFGNLAMGFLGIATLLRPDWLIPAAIVTAIYFALAASSNAANAGRNADETLTLVSDLANRHAHRSWSSPWSF